MEGKEFKWRRRNLQFILIHRTLLLLLYNFGTLGCQLMSNVKSGSKSITRTNGLADSACITSKVIFQTAIIITIHCACLVDTHWNALACWLKHWMEIWYTKTLQARMTPGQNSTSETLDQPQLHVFTIYQQLSGALASLSKLGTLLPVRQMSRCSYLALTLNWNQTTELICHNQEMESNRLSALNVVCSDFSRPKGKWECIAIS